MTSANILAVLCMTAGILILGCTGVPLTIWLMSTIIRRIAHRIKKTDTENTME